MEKESITTAAELRRVATRLAYFQDDGEYSFIDKYQEVTSWISSTCKQLVKYKGSTPEEEAEICMSILLGYSTTMRDIDDIDEVLSRTYKVLPALTPSFLKCSLLTYCYSETYDTDLANEAEQIMSTWTGRDLTQEESRLKELLQDLRKMA